MPVLKAAVHPCRPPTLGGGGARSRSGARARPLSRRGGLLSTIVNSELPVRVSNDLAEYNIFVKILAFRETKFRRIS